MLLIRGDSQRTKVAAVGGWMSTDGQSVTEWHYINDMALYYFPLRLDCGFQLTSDEVGTIQ